MIIVLSKDETIESAKIGLRKIIDDSAIFDNYRDLFYQTNLNHEDVKDLVDIYVR